MEDGWPRLHQLAWRHGWDTSASLHPSPAFPPLLPPILSLPVCIQKKKVKPELKRVCNPNTLEIVIRKIALRGTVVSSSVNHGHG